MASTAAEPATRGETDRGRRKKTQRVGSAWTVRSFWGGGGESTALMPMEEEYEGNGVFGSIGGCVKLLVDSPSALPR